MDDLDRAILNILQVNCKVSTEDIGHEVGLSASACQRRIKKLRAQGIIEKEVAIVDRDKLQSLTTVIVDVCLEKGGEQALDDFIARLNREKRVQQFYYTAGEVDFVLIIVVKNMGEFDELTRGLLMSNTNVKKFHSKVAIKNNKLGLEVPV